MIRIQALKILYASYIFDLRILGASLSHDAMD